MPFGEVDENNLDYYFEDDKLENLGIALIPDYKTELYDTCSSSSYKSHYNNRGYNGIVVIMHQVIFNILFISHTFIECTIY
jgi:hypothetical protein